MFNATVSMAPKLKYNMTTFKMTLLIMILIIMTIIITLNMHGITHEDITDNCFHL